MTLRRTEVRGVIDSGSAGVLAVIVGADVRVEFVVRFPGRVIVALPFDKVAKLLAVPLRVEDVFDGVFFFAFSISRDGGTGFRSGAGWEQRLIGGIVWAEEIDVKCVVGSRSSG